MPAKKSPNVLALAAAHLFAVGDKVMAMGMDTTNEHAAMFGKNASRYTSLGDGDECTVVKINNDGTIDVRYGGSTYVNEPFTNFYLVRKTDGNVIELNDEYEAEIMQNGTIASVGCQDVPFAAVEKLYNAMKAKQPKPVVAKKAAKKAVKKVARKR